MKRAYYIITVLGIIIIVSAYLIIRFSVLKTTHPKPDISKSQSIIDLRPLMIAKLQQIVKAGSDGLYNLSIEKLEPDILQSTVNIFNLKLTPDSIAYKKLDSLKKAPDDVFKFSFNTLRITGINVDDFLHSDKINLDSIFITLPFIEVYHKSRPYNEAGREKEKAATLYQNIESQLKHLKINKIIVQHGSFINKNLSFKNNTQKFNDVSINISDLLFDSVTQFDKSRFLFSKQVNLSCKNYLARTPDSLYFFKAGSVSVDAVKHTITGREVALQPRYSKPEFEKKLKFIENRFDIRMPRVVFTDIDWWALINNEYFSSGEAHIYNAAMDDYIDRSLPADPNHKLDNFPQQLLMQIPIKLNVASLKLHNLNMTYEEHNPDIKKKGKVYFNAVNGEFKNITNVPDIYRKKPYASFAGSALFMHTVPVKANFQFNLAKYKTGDFLVTMHVGAMDSTIVNPIAEPMGLFSFKTGQLQQADAHVEGNNFSSTGSIEMLYNDLHLIPLKKDNNNTGSLKKKTFTSFVANTFFIKDANPLKGQDIRKPTVVVPRDHHESFFNFVWKTILTGILKTIGVPVKFANK